MKEIKKFGGYLSFLLGVIAIVLMFVKPALYFGDKLTEINLFADYNTFNTIFGVEHVFDFNVLGLVALIALALGLLARFLKLKKGGNYFLSAVLLVVAGALLFVYPTTISGFNQV